LPNEEPKNKNDTYMSLLFSIDYAVLYFDPCYTLSNKKKNPAVRCSTVEFEKYI
jgi:hypothetical protein